MLTPLRSIRAHCVECAGGNVAEVRRCPVERCALYQYRLGHNPAAKRELTEEQREAVKSRLSSARIAQRTKTKFTDVG